MSRCAFGAVPTMEGLFRNGANPTHQGNVVSIHLLTEQVYGEEKRKAIYTKLIFFLKNDRSADLIQIVYHNKNMDMSSIVRVAHLKDLPGKINFDRDGNRKLLFSLFEMFFLNRSASIGRLLKQIDSSFVLNKEILNEEAVSLYRKYRNHLRRNKGVANPAFNFEAEKKKIGSFYQRDSSVKLVKISEQFFWKIELDRLKAFFTNEKHQLREMELNVRGDQISISTDGFATFSKIYELPKAILFKNKAGEIFSFKTLRFKVFKGNERYMDKTAKKYMTYEEKFRQNKFKIKSLLKDSLNFYF